MHKKKHEMMTEVRRQYAQNCTDGADTVQLFRAQSAMTNTRPFVEVDHGNRLNDKSGSEAIKPKNGVSGNELREEDIALAYFSQPSQGSTEEQNRFRMVQSLSDFFGCSEFAPGE